MVSRDIYDFDRAGSSPESDDAMEDELAEPVVATPRRRGRPPKAKPSTTPVKASQADGTKSTPKGPRSAVSKAKLETPHREGGPRGLDTPGRRTIADRSARRKTARALIERVVDDATSDDEGGDEGLAREIFESSGDEAMEEEDRGVRDGDLEEGEEGEEDAQATPSKTARGGRKGKAMARKRSPTPPRDLPPHELYFFQNKPGLAKTSNNTLASLNLLTHDEYFSILRDLKDPHEEDIKFLEDLHAESFGQWSFELAEGFNLCLYGYGSKRPLLHRFAKHLHSKTTSSSQPAHKIVILNGYVRTISVREVLSTISSAVDPAYKLTSGNPVALLHDVLALISTSATTLTLILNSADAPPLRKSASFYTVLAQLAAHPRVRLACSVDTPDFALLWDSGQRAALNLVFHDCTTFARRSPAELEVVDDVHELLGRRARRVGGRDGVAFVLKSLPDNAKNLFRLLVGEVLVALEDEGGDNPGVEYRMLYNKAVEEFICSSEMAFRTLLKEFHDHQMITSRKDVLGTELLSLPFRKEELEAILEDLMS
ncbi:origin recognition complex subunit 2 [Diaporthe helianthi]|uniref:Origin recognition complex subunit 2 n=1 Tax=Diaporthe helianthi TaxID=158607 RepID=A0A2P5IA81_DIAHE|nr:origin recognition complex subunit 2 [Diaporthe helianthi]